MSGALRLARVLAVALVVLAAAAPPALAAAVERLDQEQVVARSQAAIGRMVGDYQLTTSESRALSLASLRGRPLVVSLIYTSCSTVCPVATRQLQDAVARANRLIGSDRFTVLTIGFDARNDTPTRVAQFASIHGAPLPNWLFASADEATLTSLLEELGFSYAAVTGGFDHISQTTLIDADGRIRRQIYGEEFPYAVLVEPLRNLVYGRWSVVASAPLLLDRIRFICTTFDPSAGRYRIDYGLLFGGSLGALSLILCFALFAREWRRSRRAPPAA